MHPRENKSGGRKDPLPKKPGIGKPAGPRQDGREPLEIEPEDAVPPAAPRPKPQGTPPSKPPPVPRQIAGAGTIFDEPAPFPEKPKPPPASSPKPAKPAAPAGRKPANPGLARGPRPQPLLPGAGVPGPLLDPHAKPALPVRRPAGGGIHSSETAVEPEDLEPAPAPRPGVASAAPPAAFVLPPRASMLPDLPGLLPPDDPGSRAIPGVAETRHGPDDAAPGIPGETPTPPSGIRLADEDNLPLSGEAPEDAARDGEQPGFEFRGSGAGLFPLKVARLLCAAAGTGGLGLGAAILLGSAAFEIPELPAAVPREAVERAVELLPRARELLPEAFRDLPFLPFALLGAGAVLLLFALLFHRAVKVYRWTHTVVFGEPVSVQSGLFSSLTFLAGGSIILLGTAGLAVPWLLVWARRGFLQECIVKAGRREKKLDFAGTGGEALGLLLFGLATSPLIPLTLGLWLAFLRFRWAAWEQRSLRVPSPSGHGTIRARFGGRAGPYVLREALGAGLFLITGGLGGSWATAARWRWIADRTELPPEEEEEGKESRKGKRHREGR